MPPFTVRGLDHVVVLVGDLERAMRFYGDVVGATVDNDLMVVGMMQMRIGASLIDLVDIASEAGAWARPEVSGGRNVDHFAIAVEEVDPDALRAHLDRHGVAILEEGVRYGATGNGWSWYIRDPDGNTVELKGPPLPD